MECRGCYCSDKTPPANLSLTHAQTHTHTYTNTQSTVSLSHGHGGSVVSKGMPALSHQVSWQSSSVPLWDILKTGAYRLCWFGPDVGIFKDTMCSTVFHSLKINFPLSQDFGPFTALKTWQVPFYCHYYCLWWQSSRVLCLTWPQGLWNAAAGGGWVITFLLKWY